MKHIFFLCTVMLAAIPLRARDFDVVSPSGHTLYCDVVAGGAAIVGWAYSAEGSEPIRLTIPSLVSNGSADMRVVAIGDGAFGGSIRMVHVEIPSSVKRIGRHAFAQCYGLGCFSIPATVDSIAQEAFAGVPVVEYSGTAQGAPWGASCLNAYHEGQYYFADSMKTHLICCEKDAADATIPPTVTSIADGAFACCYNITSVRIYSNVCYVGDFAFSDCTSLEEVYFNPTTNMGVGYAGACVFSDCVHLRRLVLGNTVTTIPFRFCSGCISLKTVVVPDNITDVGSDAFINCTSLETAVLGSGLVSVGVSMFEGCTSLREVSMSDNLQVINVRAFFGCSSLGEVVLPEALDLISGAAFFRCSGIVRIVCMSNSVPTTYGWAFEGVDSAAEVIVPCGKENLYRQDTVWQRFSNMKGQKYYMVVTTNNPLWGKAVVTQQPTCDDSSAIIEAIPEEGCRFVKWDDDNAENPRLLSSAGGGNLRRQAIFESMVGVRMPGALPTVEVYYSQGNIVVEGAQGEQVWLFDVMGRLLLSTKAASASFSIASSRILASGVYLVKVGNRKAEKVVVM